MKLIYKFFAAFLLTSVILIALMVGIMQYFASRHFTDYVAKVELERLADVVTSLKQEYRASRGWHRLMQDQSLWERMTRFSRPEDRMERPPLPPRPLDSDRRMEPSLEGNGPPPGSHRLSLYDDKKQLIVGWRDEFSNQVTREIKIDGKTVGWLGLSRPRHTTDPLQLNFFYQQMRAFILVGCGILILAALVAYLLSRHLLRPIRELAVGAHALSSRRFDTRVQVHSSDELGALVNDFNKMANTLERYEYMRRQWISDISHELRTPLAVLRGEIEAVMDGVRDLRKETLESLHAEVMLLSKIVDDLHTITVIESETMTMDRRRVPVLQIAADVLGAFQARFEEKGIAVQKDPNGKEDATVLGDPERLAQVFSNLYENVLRYTDPPGRVCIRHERGKGMLTLYVEDSPPGVPDAAMPFIFDRMYRVDRSRSRKAGGSGLGLAISKAIIEGHDGSIQAAHSSLGGLQIQINLPCIRKPGYRSNTCQSAGTYSLWKTRRRSGVCCRITWKRQVSPLHAWNGVMR